MRGCTRREVWAGGGGGWTHTPQYTDALLSWVWLFHEEVRLCHVDIITDPLNAEPWIQHGSIEQGGEKRLKKAQIHTNSQVFVGGRFRFVCQMIRWVEGYHSGTNAQRENTRTHLRSATSEGAIHKSSPCVRYPQTSMRGFVATSAS